MKSGMNVRNIRGAERNQTYKIEETNPSSSSYTPVPHEPPSDYRLLGELEIPTSKDKEENNTNDQPSNDRRVLPSALSSLAQRQRKQDQGNSSTEQHKTHKVELLSKSPDTLSDSKLLLDGLDISGSSTTNGFIDKTKLLCFVLSPVQCDNEWREGGRHENSKHAI